MNRKTFIDKLKDMFNEVEQSVAPLEAEVDNFIDVTTIDGILLRVKEEEIVEGVQVFVVGEDGEEVPAPEGEHTIEDKVIVTDSEGKVVEVKEIEAPVDAPVEETVEEVEAKRLEVEAKRLEELEAEKLKASSDLEARLISLENSIANLSESMSAIDGLSKVVAEIAGLPADKEIKMSKADNADSKEKSNSRADILKSFSKR